MDKIILKKMKIYGHTGCLPEEKKNGQFFYVTAQLFCGKIEGCYTDNLDDTVNYAALYERIREVVESDSGNLIEHLAQRIADAILSFAPMCFKTTVEVSKPDAPVDGIFETMEVIIERER